MIRKMTALFLVLCLLLSFPASAASAARSSFVVNACIGAEPETVDPSLVYDTDGCTYVLHQFENLMKYQPGEASPADDRNMKRAEVVPGQARSYTVSADQKVYTFTLRDDIYWSDGQPVKAQDWVFSWQRLVDPDTAADYGCFLDGIVLNAAAIQAGEKDKSELGIKAVDDKTLEITLEAPCAYFLEMCAAAILMPLREDVVKDGWTEPGNLVVNGPYKITAWVHDSFLKMERNENYYDVAKLGPDEIVFWLGDGEAALSAYEAGEYQFVGNVPFDRTADLRASGDCFVNPSGSTYYLYLNCAGIADWRVRAAMTLSVDRENIVENVTSGIHVPAVGLVASGIRDSTGGSFASGGPELGALYSALQRMYPDADLSAYEGRCALARKLYREAVDEGAWDPDAVVAYSCTHTSDAGMAVALLCGIDWGTVLDLDVVLTAEPLEYRTFDAAAFGWVADYDDPVNFLELMVADGDYNYASYSDPDFDAMIARAKAMPAGTERDALLHEAEELLFGEGGFAVCPLYDYRQPYCSRGLANIGYSAMGCFFFTYAQPGPCSI